MKVCGFLATKTDYCKTSVWDGFSTFDRGIYPFVCVCVDKTLFV